MRDGRFLTVAMCQSEGRNSRTLDSGELGSHEISKIKPTFVKSAVQHQLDGCTKRFCTTSSRSDHSPVNAALMQLPKIHRPGFSASRHRASFLASKTWNLGSL
jgi:hypothetical protein